MEVGAAFVRIRPYVADEDVRGLEALDRLSHEIAAAFDRFREDQAPSALPASMTSTRKENGMEHPEIVKVRVWPGEDGDYWVAAFSSNGREIFRSSEGYANHLDAVGAARTSWPDAELDDEVVA